MEKLIIGSRVRMRPDAALPAGWTGSREVIGVVAAKRGNKNQVQAEVDFGPSAGFIHLVPAVDLEAIGQAPSVVADATRWLCQIQGEKSATERLSRLEEICNRSIDLLGSVLPVHEANRIVTFSDSIRSQVPRSYAANAYQTLTRSLLDVEMARLARLWDSHSWTRNSLATAYWLTRSRDVRELCDARAGDTIEGYPGYRQRLLDQQAHRWKRLDALLPQAFTADVVTRISNYRDKHLSHSLTSTVREAKDAVPPPTYKDQRRLLSRSILLADLLNLLVRGTGFSWGGLFEIARKNSEAFWLGVKIEVVE